MTIVLVICAVLAVLVLAVIVSKFGWAIRSSPDHIRPSRPHRRRRDRTSSR